MKDTQNKGKGILKRTAALALAVMTFATSFSCNYAAVGAFAAEVTKDATKTITAKVGTEKKKTSKSKTSSTTTTNGAKKKSPRKAPMKAAANDSLPTVEAETTNGDNRLLVSTATSGQNMKGWSVEFTDDYSVIEPVTNNGKTTYRIAYFDHANNERFNNVEVTLTYTIKIKGDNGTPVDHTYKVPKKCIEGGEIKAEYNNSPQADTNGYGRNTGKITVRTTENFQNIVNREKAESTDTSAAGGITILYDTYKSIMNRSYTISLRESQSSTPHNVTWNTQQETGTAKDTFQYTGNDVKPEVYLTTIVDGSSNDRQIGSGDSASNGTVNYNDNNTSEAGTYSMDVTLPSDFHYEKFTIYYSVGARSLAENMVSPTTPVEKVYTGVKPSLSSLFTVTNSGNTLLESTKYDKNGVGTDNDYYIDWGSKDYNVGTHDINITGVGHYNGSVPRQVEITKKVWGKSSSNGSVTTITNSGGKASDTEIKITMPEGTYNAGGAVEPDPVITYEPTGVTNSDGSQYVNHLVKGTDYTVSYSDNKGGIGTTGKATITFRGNYEGSVDTNFKIANGKINSDGYKIFVNGKNVGTLQHTTEDNGDQKLADHLDANKDEYAIEFSPDKNELPRIQIQTPDGDYLTAGTETTDPDDSAKKVDTGDFIIGTPESNSKTWGKQDSNKVITTQIGDWRVKLTGVNNYDGSSLTVKIKVKPLDISAPSNAADDKLRFTGGFRTSNGNSYADLQYDNNVNGTSYSATVGYSSRNFTITPTNNKDVKASGNVELTITGNETTNGYKNYTGTRKIRTSKGYDLSKASTARDADVRLTYYDPYTGENLTVDNKPMPYYGNDSDGNIILPRIIIEVKTGKDSYQQKTDFTVGANPQNLGTGTSQTTGDIVTTYALTITGGGHELYGTVPNSDPDSAGRTVIGKQNISATNQNVIVKGDPSEITSFADFATIEKQVKLYVKPVNAGKRIYITEKDGVETASTTEPDSGNPKYKYSWTATDYWTGANSDGTLLTTADYTYTGSKPAQHENGLVLNESEFSKSSRTIKVHGDGNYTGEYDINLDKVDIGKSTDFEIRPFTKENAWNGQPVFPTVGLYQKSTGRQIDPTSYYVIYSNKDGYTYVLSTYAEYDGTGNLMKSEVTDQFDIKVDGDNNVTQITTTSAAAKGINLDSTQRDPDKGKGNNEARYFADPDDGYKATIVMKDDKWTDSSNKAENTTGLYGQITSDTYSVTKQSTNPKINAYFTRSSVQYGGFNNGTGNTPKPELSGSNDSSHAAPTGGTKLIVQDTAGNDLKKGTDYTISTHENDSDIYYQYPGVKEITIIGKGKYAGTSVVSYTVTGDLSKIGNSNYFDIGNSFRIPQSGETQRLTVYTNGNGGFVYEDGTEFSLKNISISIPSANVTLNNGEDYDFSPADITTAGNVDLWINGRGAYSGSHYIIYLSVVESRSGLTWSDGSSSIQLTWRSNGYTLGEDELALHSTFSDKNVTLQPISGTGDNQTGDKVTVNPETRGDNNKDSVRPHFTGPGTYTITISGPPKANQSSQLTVEIKYDLSQASVDLTNGGQVELPHTYDNKDPYTDNAGFTSAVKVTLPGMDKPLTYGQDYNITRDAINNKYTDAGTYKVILSAGSTSKFTGDVPSLSYDILPLNISDNLHPADLDVDLTYNGKDQSASIPDIAFANKVTYDDNGITMTLTKGTDFDVTYPDGCTNAGRTRYLVTGKGNYAGATNYGYFTIKQYDLKDAKIKVKDQYYQGGAEVIPDSITITNLDGLVVSADDNQYTAQCTNNTNPGTAQMIITAVTNGNFINSATVNFKINKLDIAEAVRTSLINTPATYTGSYLYPDTYIQLYIPRGNNNYYLQLDSDQSGVDKPDFSYSFQRVSDGDGKSVTEAPDRRPLHAGTYQVTLTALAGGRLGGTSATFNFTVNQQDISTIASQFTVDDADWTGNALTADNGINVKQNGSPIDRKQFNVTPNSHVTEACGTFDEMRAFNSSFAEDDLPAVTISGSGDYTGVIKRTFRIGKPFESNTTYTINESLIRYDGQEHIPGFTLRSSISKYNIENVVYSTENPSDATNAGDYVITLTATSGPFYGTKQIKYTIYPASGNTWIAEFVSNSGMTMDSSGQYTVQYQGAAITPGVRAYLLGANGTRTEIPLQASEITYANNNAAGTASVTIKPQNYEGTKVLYFKILGVDISQDNSVYVAFSDGITRRKYTGSAIQPTVTVTFAGSRGTVTLTKDRDYSLTYENNTNAGAANVKVTGIGNYSGTRDLPFAIWADLNDKTSTFTIPKQMYTGEPITELTGATIKAGGNDLVLGTDYTLSITSTDAFRTKGTAIFTAQGQYYEGTRTVQFDIGNDASMYNVIGVASTYVFDHQAHKPVPVVTDKEGTVYPTDSVIYSSTSDGDSCVNAGNVRMTINITSHGQTVSIPYNYIIEARNINTATFTPLRDVNYNGKAHTPAVRITEGTRLLTGSSTISDGTADYVVAYYNNIQPGKAQVVVTGINNYTGTANLYFDINVKAAPQMIVTAMPSGRLKVTWNRVSGVSGYRVFYTPTNGTQRQVNISSSKKSTYLTGLTRGVVYTVGVQSYVTANGVRGYSSASVQQIATSTKKPTITSAKSTGKGRIQIKWKKVSNATAYMVYRRTGSRGKWTRVKTTKSTSFTNTGLKSGQRYTYKVISYKQSGVKRSFSQYSTGRTVRAK